MGFLKLLKGTKLRDNAEEFGLIYRSKAPYEVLQTNSITYEELAKLKGIAFLVEKYYNSGKFKKALKYLLSLYNEPFDFYESYYDYWDKNNLLYRRYSLNNLYDILNNCAKSQKIVDSELFIDYLKFDYMYNTDNRAYPVCLKGNGLKIPDDIKSLIHNVD